MKKISVVIITNRHGGIDAQLKYFSNQTFKEFEIVIIDDLWMERHEEIEDLIKQLELDVVYIKPRRDSGNVVASTHALARNEALIYVDAEYVLFFDDYQIPAPPLLEEHIKCWDNKTAVVGQQINLNYVDMNNPDYNNIKASDHRYIDNRIKEIDYAWFWTNNASVAMNSILTVNGLDERYNGGTGGEDGGLGLSLHKLGTKFVYNPNALCYHIDHDAVPQASKSIKRLYENQNINPEKQYIFGYSDHLHDLSPFVNNPFHDGDPNLMENDQFTCWRDKWTIKHYRCKLCGIEGICDSLEVLEIKKREDTYLAPLELFGLQTAREKFKQETEGRNVYVR